MCVNKLVDDEDDDDPPAGKNIFPAGRYGSTFYVSSLVVEFEYTFSHCESAPSQLNAAWGNSFRQLHSNFDNLLALRQISLE